MSVGGGGHHDFRRKPGAPGSFGGNEFYPKQLQHNLRLKINALSKVNLQPQEQVQRRISHGLAEPEEKRILL